MTAAQVTVYVRPGDPDSAALLRWLEERGVAHRVSDVTADPAASATLFGRLGRVAVPTLQVGDRLLVGFDPVQLARFLPRAEEEAHVSFGAAVRSVGAEVARRHGLPAVYGVEVGRVSPGSPAATAGVVAGDLIVAVGGYTLQGGAEQFRTAVAARRPGDTMRLGVWREEAGVEVEVSFPMPVAPGPDPGGDATPAPGET